MSKINLLPQDRAEANKARKGWIGTAFAVIVFVGLLGATFVFFKGQESAAQAAYDAQVAQNAQLEAEIQSLEPYAELRSKYQEGAERVGGALATDVAWGRLLGDFGRMISDKRVWMESLSVATEAPDEESPGVYGAVQMAGSGFDYPDVSSWLLTLDSQDWDAVTGAWAASVAQNESDDTTLVGWNLTTSITEGALSDRIDTRIPEVPE